MRRGFSAPRLISNWHRKLRNPVSMELSSFSVEIALIRENCAVEKKIACVRPIAARTPSAFRKAKAPRAQCCAPCSNCVDRSGSDEFWFHCCLPPYFLRSLPVGETRAKVTGCPAPRLSGVGPYDLCDLACRSRPSLWPAIARCCGLPRCPLHRALHRSGEQPSHLSDRAFSLFAPHSRMAILSLMVAPLL